MKMRFFKKIEKKVISSGYSMEHVSDFLWESDAFFILLYFLIRAFMHGFFQQKEKSSLSKKRPDYREAFSYIFDKFSISYNKASYFRNFPVFYQW